MDNPPRLSVGDTKGLFQAPTGERTAIAPHSFTPTLREDGSRNQTLATEGARVLKAMSVRLKETYRKADPTRPATVDEAPRRALTHPSVPMANG